MLVVEQPDRLRCLLNSLPKLKIKIPLEEFTLFPKLPVELRYRIWRLASHVPQRLALHAINNLAPGHIPVPAILQASSGSRIEGLRYYTKCEEKISIALKAPLVYLRHHSDSQFSTSSSDMVQAFEHLPPRFVQREKEDEEESQETKALKKDPKLPAKLHGNEPRNAAKIDAQIQAEEEEEVTNCIYVNFEADTFVFQKRWANFDLFDTSFDPKVLGKIKFLEGPSSQLHQCTRLFKMMGNLMHLTLTESKDWPWLERTYSDDLRGHLSLQDKKQELANRFKVDKLTLLFPKQRNRLLKVEFIPRSLISDEDLVPAPERFYKKGHSMIESAYQAGVIRCVR